MLKKAAVKKLKSAAIKKAGQAISGATKGLVPGELGEKVAESAAKKALPSVFKKGGKMKAKKKKKYQRGGGPVDPTLDTRADQDRGSKSKAPSRKTRKPAAKKRTAADVGLSLSGGSGMGSVFAEDQMLNALDKEIATAKSNAKQLEEKSEEAANKRPRKTKEERKARRQEVFGKVKKGLKKGQEIGRELRDNYEARAARNKHQTAAMTAMSSYEKGGKMKPTDPKKKIKSMLEGGASDKEINAYLKKQGIDKTHDVSWDNVEMKVTMKPKKGNFGEPDKPGQRSDNFEKGGKVKKKKAPITGGAKDPRVIAMKSGERRKNLTREAIRSATKGKIDPAKPKSSRMKKGGKMKYKAGGSVPTTAGGTNYSKLSYENKMKLQKSLQAQLNAAKSSKYASQADKQSDIAGLQAKITKLNKFIPKAKPTTKARFKKGGKMSSPGGGKMRYKRGGKQKDVQGQYTQAIKNGKVEYENRKGQKEDLKVSRRAAKTADKQGYLKDANYKRKRNKIVRIRKGKKA